MTCGGDISRASAPAETSIGSQLGSVVGGHIGARHDPLGSTLGSQVDTQTERTVAYSAAANPTKYRMRVARLVTHQLPSDHPNP